MQKKKYSGKLILLCLVFLAFIPHSSPAQPSQNIGKQVWLKTNLMVITFCNGDPIPLVTSIEAWKKAGKDKTPAMCYYQNSEEVGLIFGALYNWYAVNDPRGLAPIGWHIPSDNEWKELTAYLGGDYLVGPALKSEFGWEDPSTEAIDGTNNSGFTALPAGFRNWGGRFSGYGDTGEWWSSTSAGLTNAWHRGLSVSTGGMVMRQSLPKATGMSVRCIKDWVEINK